MIISVSQAIKTGSRWAEKRSILEYFNHCVICHQPIDAGDDVDLVFTKRKDWIMFHTRCFYKEVKQNAEKVHTM